MSRKKKTSDQGGPKVPGYIVTYSDMVTLLLTFFVMLLSLAEQQDPELVSSGRDAFVQAINGFGLGMLFGKEERYREGGIKVRHAVEDPEQAVDDPALDATEEQLQRLFDQVEEMMITKPSQLVAEEIDFTVTKVRFEPGSHALSESAEAYLSEFCQNLQGHVGAGQRTLYVLGLAPDSTSARQQWTLSARRAQTVADYIDETLPADLGWSVYCWGAGPGGKWSSRDSIVSENQHIMIAVMQNLQ